MKAVYFEKWFWHKRTGIGLLSIDDARRRHHDNQAYVALLEHESKILFLFAPGWVSVVLMDASERPVTEIDLIDDGAGLRLKAAKHRVFGHAGYDPIQCTMINLNEGGHIVGAEALGPSKVYKAYLADGPSPTRPPFGEFEAVLKRVSSCTEALELETAREGQLLQIVSKSSVCADYYRLCDAHPTRMENPSSGLGSKDLMRSASGRVLLDKVSGPGHGYEVGGLPEGVSLMLIIQGRTSIEAAFSVCFQTAAKVGTVAALCHETLLYSGQTPRTPPFPRPEFSSAEEFVEITVQLRSLVVALADSMRGASR